MVSNMQRDAERIGVWGRSGSGKTAWVKRYLAKKSRVVIFDPQGEYLAQVKTVIEHRHNGSLDEVRRAMLADPRGFRISYIPPPGKEVAALDGLSKTLWRAQQGYRAKKRGSAHIVLVVEEMNMSFKVHGGAERCPGFANICSRGRASGIEAVGVSQGIAEVATRFRRNCSQTVVFAQADGTDRKAAGQVLFMKPDQIEDLPALSFLHRKNDQVTRGKITFPKKK